jgi:hypothetical protein
MKVNLDKNILEAFEKIVQKQNEFFLKELDKRFKELEDLRKWKQDLRMSVIRLP